MAQAVVDVMARLEQIEQQASVEGKSEHDPSVLADKINALWELLEEVMAVRTDVARAESSPKEIQAYGVPPVEVLYEAIQSGQLPLPDGHALARDIHAYLTQVVNAA